MTIVVKDANGAHQLDATGVPDEGHLQQFIFENPDSLPLADTKEDARLMIVGREFTTNSGPIDVLAIDGDGEIYIVETKLYKNPDKRRVVAQLLDYGAALWRGFTDPGSFVAALEACVNRQGGGTLQENLSDFFQMDQEAAEEAVHAIAENLADGNFKFVLLMDQLDSRLRDLILFLNQRSTFDVYAVVMHFYRHEDIEIVIPKLFGAEVAKEVPRPTSESKAWNATKLFEAAKASVTSRQLKIIEKVYHFATTHADQVRWARGKRGAFRPQFKRPYENLGVNCKVGPIFTLHTDGELSLNFGSLSRYEQLRTYRDRFAARLRELGFPGIPEDLDVESVDIPIEQWGPHADNFVQALRDVFVSGKA